MFGSIKTVMIAYFDERYATLAETATATAIAAVTAAGGGAGRAFQYRDLLLGHILMSRGLRLLGISEMFRTHYILRVERERLAHEFLDLRLQGFVRGRGVSPEDQEGSDDYDQLEFCNWK